MKNLIRCLTVLLMTKAAGRPEDAELPRADDGRGRRATTNQRDMHV